MKDGFNKYILRSLPREKRAWLIRKDARGESAFVRKCTDQALETDSLDAPKGFDKEDSDFQF